MALKDRIFELDSDAEFNKLALEVYAYQASNCKVYKEFIELLNLPHPTTIEEIPFLPIDQFKSRRIIDVNFQPEIEFKSSGTGGHRSSHFIADLSLYENSFNRSFESFIGNPKDLVILALLPNYIEQGESSLVYMVNQLIEQANPLSGFYLDNLSSLHAQYKKANEMGKQVVIFGVSYALLDLCELNENFEKAIIIETGGMKGRRQELTKSELQSQLAKGLHCKKIYSEYGMTELLSQGYSKEKLVFETSPWMKIIIRDMNDPFSFVAEGKTGGINVIDLANLHSCSFIATQDLGKITNDGFELMGRFDQADIRGCNLLVE